MAQSLTAALTKPMETHWICLSWESQSGLPIWVEVYEATAAVNKPGWGGAFLYLVGTTLANGIVELFNGTTQITTATYASIFPAGPVVMRFRAYFKSF